jgi:hypothetical protein
VKPTLAMPQTLPKLNLTHGQVVWAMSRGRPPEQKLLDQIRYLRQLGIPFNQSELGMGRGHRARYSFDQLVELGVGAAALRRGMTPSAVARLLGGGRRKSLRQLYREAYLEQPEGALDADWIKGGGQAVLAKEVFLRLHNRYSATPDNIDVIRDPRRLPVVSYSVEPPMPVFSLTRLVLELVAWAREAPETRPGPQ